VTLSTVLHALLDLEQRKQGVQRISCRLNRAKSEVEVQSIVKLLSTKYGVM